MKPYLLLLLLLIPIAYAQDNHLEARKASLDLRAGDFILQMNTAVDFLKTKNIETKDIEATKASFESKLNEALASTTINDLKSKEKELRTISKKFKEQIKSAVKTNAEELRNSIKSKEIERNTALKDKLSKAEELKRNSLRLAYDNRISELKEVLKQNNSTIYRLLLNDFEKEKIKINSTKIETDSGTSIFSQLFSAITGAVSKEIKKANVTI